MQVDLSPSASKTLKTRAEARGLSESSYVEALVREPELWGEQDDASHPDPSGAELDEIREAVGEGLQDADAGRLAPAEEVFSRIRRRHGLPG